MLASKTKHMKSVWLVSWKIWGKHFLYCWQFSNLNFRKLCFHILQKGNLFQSLFLGHFKRNNKNGFLENFQKKITIPFRLLQSLSIDRSLLYSFIFLTVTQISKLMVLWPHHRGLWRPSYLKNWLLWFGPLGRKKNGQYASLTLSNGFCAWMLNCWNIYQLATI